MGIEVTTKAGGRGTLNRASFVAIRIGVTIRADGMAGVGAVRTRWQCTTWGGMQSGLVLVHGVDTLDDVDFTMGRPVRTQKPPGRPRATPLRHVIQIGNEQAMIP